MSYDASIRVSTIIDTKDVERADKEVERLTKKLDALYAKGRKMEALGVDKNSNQWKGHIYDVAQLEADLDDAITRAKELREAFEKQNSAKGFGKITQSAKNLFNTIDKGTKKSNTGLSNTTKMLSRMMIQMMAFRGVMATIEYVKAGIDNLVQYSTELNGVFSDLKSSGAQLKNSLATAFAPILTMIIPYITQLISWLNTAMNYIAQFWAILGGKSTYTRAKKQVVDYAKSLGTATKEAKGALAAFDEINVLDKDSGANAGGGGEVTGAGAFEEVPVDSEFAEAIERVKEILELILPLVILIGAAFLGWKVFDLITSLMNVNSILGKIVGFAIFIAGTAIAIYNYLEMWENGVNWTNLIGFVGGVAIAVGALWALFGPIAAGIALIIAGVAGLVLALKDIIENGVTAENIGLLAISIIGILIGVFLTFGATAALVVAGLFLVVGVLATLVAYGGNGAEALEHLKNTFKSLSDFVKKVFAGDFKGALDDLKSAGRSFGNFFISVAEGIANGFIKMVNAVIDALNALKFDVPGWLQKLTGMQTFGFNIPHWNASVKLPRLATGGIVTSSTIANIGEAGREAVLPLENNTEWMDALADRINSGRATKIVFTGDLAELGRILRPVIEQENIRIGESFQLA